jgi:hypothetical protein
MHYNRAFGQAQLAFAHSALAHLALHPQQITAGGRTLLENQLSSAQ